MITITYTAAVPESIYVLKMSTYAKYYLYTTLFWLGLDLHIKVLITNRHLAWLCSDAVRLEVKDFFFLSSGPSDAS